MPVINSTQFIAPIGGGPPIAILDEYIIVSCETEITLTVETFDLRPGDTFWWEQIGGELIIWLSPRDQQSVTFQQNLVRDDKTFLVTINAGTDRETHATTIVSAIPRDFKFWLTRQGLYQQQYANRTFGDPESVPAAIMMPGLPPVDGVTVLNAKRWLGFDTPAAMKTGTWVKPDAAVVGFDLYDITGGGFTYVKSAGPIERSFYDLPSNREFQIVSRVHNGDFRRWEMPHEALGQGNGYFPPVGYLDCDTWESSTTQAGVGGFDFFTATHYPRELRSQSVDDEDGWRINLQHALFTATEINYTRELRTQVIDDEDGWRINLQHSKFTTTRFQMDLGIGSLG